MTVYVKLFVYLHRSVRHNTTSYSVGAKVPAREGSPSGNLVLRRLGQTFSATIACGAFSFSYHQPDPPIGLDKGFRMGHNDSIDLLVGDGLAIAAHIEPALVDFAGDLVRLHAVTGGGEEVDDGFCEVPQTLIIDSQII